MPYLPLDLDAKKAIPKVGRVANMSPGDVLWGLSELWEHVWLTKQPVVDPLIVVGCFGVTDRICDALIAFGFLERVEAGLRVRGAEQFLNVRTPAERGALGGKKTAEGGKSLSNLKRTPEAAPEATPEATEATPEATEATPEATPKQPRSSARSNAEALTPSTQHPTPKLLEAAAAADPRPSQMLDVWNATASGRIPKARSSDDRTPKLRRWLEKHSLAEWEALCVRVNASPLLRGDKGEWRATLDWVLKPANLTKILDGNYDDHTTTMPIRFTEACSEFGCERAGSKEFTPGRVVCLPHFDELYRAFLDAAHPSEARQ